jgi:hypothetical protein
MRRPMRIPRLVARLAPAGVALLLVAGALIAGPLSSAHAAGLSSVTDFFVPGSDPWGTAFDGSGRVWVAMPGCDPAPSCSSSTPPGKLALFDPASSSFTTVVNLPAA